MSAGFTQESPETLPSVKMFEPVDGGNATERVQGCCLYTTDREGCLCLALLDAFFTF